MGRFGKGAETPDRPRVLNSLLDTHFLIWIALRSKRLKQYSWIDRYQPWGISPVSFLEIQFLAEIGKAKVANPEFTEAVMEDPRFIVDEAPLMALIRHALKLDWTRDPFDRLLAAHSSARRVPLCTLDRTILEHHPFVAAETR